MGRANNLTTLMCRLSRNMGDSTSWNPQDLLQSLPYLYLYFHNEVAMVHPSKRLNSAVTGLEWPRGFQEVKVPRFHDNGTGWW